MEECENFICGSCCVVQFSGMFGEIPPPDADGVIWAGEITGSEESMACSNKEICKEYKVRQVVN